MWVLFCEWRASCAQQAVQQASNRQSRWFNRLVGPSLGARLRALLPHRVCSVVLIVRVLHEEAAGHRLHTVSVLVDGVDHGISGIRAGVGDDVYEDTAKLVLDRHGITFEEPLWAYCQERNIARHTEVIYVAHGKDLQ